MKLIIPDFDEQLINKGYSKHAFDTIKKATLFQKRHSFDVKHYYNIWEYDFSDIAPQLGHSTSYEVEMCFETYDGIWSKINFYGLSQEEVLLKIDTLTSRLYSAMIEMNGNPTNYHGTDP